MTEPTMGRFEASDGYAIAVERWDPPHAPRAICVVLHGVQSHAGWYHRLGRTLAESGIEAHFPDRRGSGSNRRDRGHCPSAGRLIDDVLEFVGEVRRGRASTPLILAGISWGGKLVVVSAASDPGAIDGLALICPGLEPRVGVTLPERLRIALAYFVRRRARFPIPLSDPALFTENPEAQRFIREDPLGLRTATAGLLAASMFLDRRVKRALPRVIQPSLLMLAGRDRIVDNDRTRASFARLASLDKTILEYPEAHHTLEFEPDPDRYASDLIAWIDSRWTGRSVDSPEAGAGRSG